MTSIHQITTKIIQYLKYSQTLKRMSYSLNYSPKHKCWLNISMPIAQISETQILEIINQKSQKGEGLSQTGAWKHTNTCITNRSLSHEPNIDAIKKICFMHSRTSTHLKRYAPCSDLSSRLLHEWSKDHGSLAHKSEPKLYRTGYNPPCGQRDIAHR